MQFSVITALSLVASAVAVPAPVGTRLNLLKLKEAIASNYTWTVTDWKTADGCASGADCTYSFSVSGAAWKTSIPAFNASCSGSELDAPYTTCSGTASGQLVKAKLGPAAAAGGPDANLTVSYQFDDPNQANTYWNYTGFATQPWASGSIFAVRPTEVWGVA